MLPLTVSTSHAVVPLFMICCRCWELTALHLCQRSADFLCRSCRQQALSQWQTRSNDLQIEYVSYRAQCHEQERTIAFQTTLADRCDSLPSKHFGALLMGTAIDCECVCNCRTNARAYHMQQHIQYQGNTIHELQSRLYWVSLMYCHLIMCVCACVCMCERETASNRARQAVTHGIHFYDVLGGAKCRPGLIAPYSAGQYVEASLRAGAGHESHHTALCSP